MVKLINEIVYAAMLSGELADLAQALDIMDTYYYSNELDAAEAANYNELRGQLYNMVLVSKMHDNFDETVLGMIER